MEVKLEQNYASDWEYRGEGAANLILAHTGSSPVFKVARNGSSNCVKNDTVWRESKELASSPTKELAELLYGQHIMSPLLGPKHVDAAIHVPISRKFLESIEKKVILKRPAWRVDAAKIDTQHNYVLLMSDHSVFAHAETNAIKTSITRFRMHQVLKLQQNETSDLSQYDPLDIFSNSKERIHKAINDLYIAPQNNFRVFLNGSLIFGGLGSVANKTTRLIKKAFEDELKGVIESDDGLRTTSFLELVAETLYSSQVLDRLLEVQKLDNFDIEGSIHAYYNIISQPCMVCRELDEARLPNKYASLHSIPLDESLKIVRDYLIAATAKDCSLMISFRPRENRDFGYPYSSIYLQSTNQNFDYKVNFLDLDLKPLKKMEDYYEKYRKIGDLYAQMLEEKHMKGKAWGFLKP